MAVAAAKCQHTCVQIGRSGSTPSNSEFAPAGWSVSWSPPKTETVPPSSRCISHQAKSHGQPLARILRVGVSVLSKGAEITRSSHSPYDLIHGRKSLSGLELTAVAMFAIGRASMYITPDALCRPMPVIMVGLPAGKNSSCRSPSLGEAQRHPSKDRIIAPTAKRLAPSAKTRIRCRMSRSPGQENGTGRFIRSAHAVTAFRGRPRGRNVCSRPGAAAVRFTHGSPSA